MATQATATVRRADRAEDYALFKVDPNSVVPAEDGPRIDTGPGHFEWWYFDAILKDGVSIIVIFYTKPPIPNPQLPLTPVVSISIKRPNEDGPLKKREIFTPQVFSAPAGQCDVGIGSNRITGDLSSYTVVAAIDGVSVRMQLRSITPPLRVGTGHLLFDSNGNESYFGWLAPVPRGVVDVEYEVDGVRIVQTGTGYHDHNWGNAPMASLMHDWYWGRAQVGAYTIIAAHITAQAAYGNATHTDLILIKDGQFIARGSTGVVFAADHVANDPQTGKPIALVTRYTFVDANARYVVTFARDEGKKIFVEQIGEAAYHRFIGTCTIDIAARTVSTTLPPAPAVWEFMWLGNAPSADALELYAKCMAHTKD